MFENFLYYFGYILIHWVWVVPIGLILFVIVLKIYFSGIDRFKAKTDYINSLIELEHKKQTFLINVKDNLDLQDKDKNMTIQERKREWFYNLVADAEAIEADIAAKWLREKKRPALAKANEISGPIKEKIRHLKRENARLSLELEIFDEFFPEYKNMREHILDTETVLEETSEDGDKIDQARKYLTPKEYNTLNEEQRNQLALDKYINRNHSPQEIGRFYERYIGFKYEIEGWKVEFKGIIDGLEDLGRDLICKKGSKVLIIQAKNWSLKKTIHEKHIYQLFATKTHFCLENNLSNKNVKAIFTTPTPLSEMAKKVAKYLKVEILNIPLSKEYPMIKCNFNPQNNTKIYHLPFDQQYDKIAVGDQKGEQYVKSVQEAEDLGFRRAFRWKGRHT